MKKSHGSRGVLYLLAALLLWGVAAMAEAGYDDLREWGEEELARLAYRMELEAGEGTHRLPAPEEKQLPEALALAETAIRDAHGVTAADMADFAVDAKLYEVSFIGNDNIPSDYQAAAGRYPCCGSREEGRTTTILRTRPTPCTCAPIPARCCTLPPAAWGKDASSNVIE